MFERFIPFVLLGGLLSVSAVLTACGADSKSATTTSTVASTTSTTISAETASVLDGYRQFWDAYRAASDPMNPEDERLTRHATGKELAQVRSAFLARKSAGHVIRGTFELSPRVASIADTRAVVADCYFDHTQLFDLATNAPLEPADTERESIEATLQLIDGIWKVSEINHKGTGCVPGS